MKKYEEIMPIIFSVMALILMIVACVCVAQGKYALWIAYMSLSGIIALQGRMSELHKKIDRLTKNSSKCNCADKKDSEE